MIIRLVVAAMSFVLATAAPAVAEREVIGNFQPFGHGSFHAYPGMWSLYADRTMGLGRAAVENVDFVSSIEVNRSTFPGQSVIRWRVPDKASPTAGIYGYLQLSYGSFSGSVVPERVQPARVRDIDVLTLEVDFDRSGDSGFNILNETFLLLDPHDPSSTLLEVGVFMQLSKSGEVYFSQAQQLGRFTDAAGRVWKVAVDPAAPQAPFVMFQPVEAWGERGSIDWKELLEFVRRSGLADGSEWFTGIALGVEPVAGAGKLSVKEFHVTYKAASPRLSARFQEPGL